MTNGITATAARRLPMTPARRLTLVAGVPVVLALIGGTALGAVDGLASASYPVSYTFPSGHGQLTTQLESSTLTLRQAAVSAPVLTGAAHYTLFRSAFTHSGDTVRYHCPWSSGGCQLAATLQVPATSAVSLSTHGGDVSIPRFSQGVTLSTADGDLTAGTVSGALNLDTGGGDVTVAKLTGSPANLTSGGGDVTVRALATPGTTTVDSGGGDVTVTAATAPANLQITSAGGDVTIVLPRGSYDFNSDAAGGDLSQPASDPRAQDKIIVQSGGGDVTISEAS
jgi:hypothetical protein